MTDQTTTTHASGPRAGQPVTPVPDDAARRREWAAALPAAISGVVALGIPRTSGTTPDGAS